MTIPKLVLQSPYRALVIFKIFIRIYMFWPPMAAFYNDAAFMVCTPPDTSELEKLFRYEVFKMLKAEGKIHDVIIKNMMN